MLVDVSHPSTENVEPLRAHSRHDKQFSQEQQKIGHLSQNYDLDSNIKIKICSDLVKDDDADNVAHEQEKRVARRVAEVLAVHSAHDIGVAVHELEEFLEAPEAATAAAQHASGEAVVCVLLQLVVEPLEEHANHPADGDHQGAKGQSS
jgi:hypothetical protein